MWTRSATVPMADSYGQVATRCPSSTSSAYIAITAGHHWFSGKAASSLQRFQTETELQLMLVNTIGEGTYRSKIDLAVSACIVLSCMFMLTVVLLFFAVFSRSFRQWFADLLGSTMQKASGVWQVVVKFAILLIILHSVFWVVCISAEHNNLRQDNFAQVNDGVVQAVGFQFRVASSLTRQASAIWYHTGASITGLSQFDGWTSSLVKPTERLRFGTYTGVEQSVSWTNSSEFRVLSRVSSNNCLITYLADGVTQDTTIPPNCHSDPRFTEWYNTGRLAKAAHTFSNFYDSTWVASVSKACSSGISCPSDDLVGVWANEFELSAMTSTLSTLNDGFIGSIALIQISGVLVASSSGTTGGLCHTSSDQYVRSGCLELQDELVELNAEAAGVQIVGKKKKKARAEGYNLVSGELLTFDEFPELDDVFYALTVYDREQYFKTYEDGRSLGVSVTALGIIFIGLCVQQIIQKTELVLNCSEDLDREILLQFEQMTAIEELVQPQERLRQYVRALDCVIDPSCEQQLEQYALEFLEDVLAGVDVGTHIVICLWGPRVKGFLLPIFRVFSTFTYHFFVDCAMIALMVLGWNDVCTPLIQIWPLLLLVTDAAASSVFSMMMAHGFELQQNKGVNVKVRWCFRVAEIASLTYAAGVVFITFFILAPTFCEQDSDLSLYILPVLIILRNPEVLRIVEHIANALASAGNFLTMWFHMLVVISAMTTVLMHGQLNTIENDFEIDSQFQDFYFSISTMAIYLIGGNFVEVVEPALSTHGLYILLFMGISLAALFFVSAVLIEIFMGAYQKADEGVFASSGRRLRWLGLTATFFAWSQSQRKHVQHQQFRETGKGGADEPAITKSEPAFKTQEHHINIQNTWQQARALEIAEQQRFESGLFDSAPVVDSMPGSNIEGADAESILFDKDRLTQLKVDYAQAKQAQIDAFSFDGHDLHVEYARMIIAKLDAEFHEVKHTLTDLSPTVPDLLESTEPVGLSYTEFTRLMLQGKHSEAMLPDVRRHVNAALEQIEKTQHEDNCLAEVAALISLCCELGYSKEYRWLLAQGWVPDEGILSNSTSLHTAKLGMNLRNALSESWSTETQLEFVQTVLGSVSHADAVDVLSNTTVPLCLGLCGQTETDKWAVVASAIQLGHMYRVDKASSTPEQVREMLQLMCQNVYELGGGPNQSALTQQVVRLVCLVQLHKWRLYELFDSLGRNDGLVDLNGFDRLFALYRVIASIGASSLLQNEAAGLLLDREIEELEEELEKDGRKPGVCVELATKRDARRLVKSQILSELGGSSPLHCDRVAARQALALTNLAILVSINSGGENIEVLNWLLGAFPVIYLLEYILWLCTEDSSARHKHPELQAACTSSIVLMVFGLFGAALLAFDTERALTSAQTARAVAALSLLLVVTWSYEFGTIMSHFRQAAAQAAPSMILICLVVILCAVACKDAFSDEVIDPETSQAYFDTMRHSLMACFRILVGEWHDTMIEAVADTTEATQLWFYGIAFMLSVLSAELIIGVIISQYAKVDEMKNTRLQVVFAPIFEFRSAQCETMLESVLQLCRKTRVFDEVFLQISNECAQLPVQISNECAQPPEPIERAEEVEEAAQVTFALGDTRLSCH